MKYLLDTHALIWWWDEDARMPVSVREVMSDRSNAIFVSAASAWEIATKVRAGRLPGMEVRVAGYESDIMADGFHQLPVSAAHGLKGGSLDGNHRDPFDRLIAAQALLEDMTVITCDREIADFGCKVLW